MLRGILPKVAKRASDNAIRCSVSLPGGHTNCFQKGARRIKFEAAMTLDEILEQLPKLTDDEKRQLWNILDHELNGEGEESPEFLAELDARIRALDHGTRTYSLDEARQMVRNTVARARRSLLIEKVNIRFIYRSGLLHPLAQIGRCSKLPRLLKVVCLKQENHFIRIIGIAKKVQFF
jgi:hypothetical protein